ncbi:5-oxoprolinase subunit PxpB [Dethiosulfatarculus sandiegensis]|uniref:Allophanate hydrolase n=1 Tax=Dethiosulfatarculus sandiegensis TaxID=1429043 RepID=A0A0D2J902_9BACT|nr:5-oxoprolinase subunit PxpB [Dethiosulfatarculus sandiegensis]KIX12206.1 allophanate hydrolase [Dethiosulfatarculus sandiegensis]
MGLFEKPLLRMMGDRGFLVELGDEIAPLINRKVRMLTSALDQDVPEGVLEIVPTYRSILMIYDPLLTTPAKLEKEISILLDRLDSIQIPEPTVVHIPVCYGGEHGPDLEHVAKTHDLSTEEVIRIHSEPEYLIYMIGFTPGFPFLGGLPEILTTPRLESPRVLVPAGSVGIANNQTGMYSIDSPGGWQLIGRSPLKPFQPEKENPFLYQAGDYLKFDPIPPEEYDRIRAEVEAGK